MRVAESGGEPDLLKKPLGADEIAELGPEDLDGDPAIVLEILGEVDRGHPALPELALDPIAASQRGDEPAGRGIHRQNMQPNRDWGQSAVIPIPLASRAATFHLPSQ
jgi:hypothetical protein